MMRIDPRLDMHVDIEHARMMARSLISMNPGKKVAVVDETSSKVLEIIE